MSSMNMEASSHLMSSSADTLIVFLLMWFLMTIAMMLPLATPETLKFHRFARSQANSAIAFVLSGMFIIGYLLPWMLFGAVINAAIFFRHRMINLKVCSPSLSFQRFSLQVFINSPRLNSDPAPISRSGLNRSRSLLYPACKFRHLDITKCNVILDSKVNLRL